MYFFFFNDTATTEIYTLSLHDALPIFIGTVGDAAVVPAPVEVTRSNGTTATLTENLQGTLLNAGPMPTLHRDRKSTRLNSSHANISYAVFCLKKKKINIYEITH